MFCQNCGNKNKPGAKFCSKCGTVLRNKKQPERENQVDATSTSDVQPDVKQATSQPTGKADKSANSEVQAGAETTNEANSEVQNEVGTRAQKDSKKKWWLWIIPVVVLLAAGGGFYVYKNHQTNTHSESDKSVATSKKAPAAESSSASSSSEPKKSTIDFPKSTVKGTIDDAFGDMDGTTSVYVSPTDSDEEVVSNNGAQRAASNIKLFVLVTAYKQVDEGKLNLKDQYTLKESDKVDGTGEIRNMDSGTKISIQDLLNDMMEDSDNTAANIVIRQLGGMDKVNDQIKKIGAKDTKLERMLMDTDALKDGKDNYTSVADLGMVLKKIYNHQMVSTKYDNAMLDILKETKNHTKLPHDLPEEATVYNKTGEFDDYGVENDAAIFGNTKGSFVIVVMSEDGDRDEQVDNMRSFGSVMYEGLLG
mgnify:FL=1